MRLTERAEYKTRQTQQEIHKQNQTVFNYQLSSTTKMRFTVLTTILILIALSHPSEPKPTQANIDSNKITEEQPQLEEKKSNVAKRQWGGLSYHPIYTNSLHLPTHVFINGIPSIHGTARSLVLPLIYQYGSTVPYSGSNFNNNNAGGGIGNNFNNNNAGAGFGNNFNNNNAGGFGFGSNFNNNNAGFGGLGNNFNNNNGAGLGDNFNNNNAGAGFGSNFNNNNAGGILGSNFNNNNAGGILGSNFNNNNAGFGYGSNFNNNNAGGALDSNFNNNNAGAGFGSNFNNNNAAAAGVPYSYNPMWSG
jgi:hypothetical protein